MNINKCFLGIHTWGKWEDTLLYKGKGWNGEQCRTCKKCNRKQIRGTRI